jgi:hypothetical protein
MTEARPPTPPLPVPGPDADPDVDGAAPAALARSLRLRVYLLFGLAGLGVIATGPLVLLARREFALIGVSLMLALAFACGFALAGRMLALSLVRRHEDLRGQLAARREDAQRALVTRWLSLDPAERTLLRERFPDVEWDPIDSLAGTAGEDRARH